MVQTFSHAQIKATMVSVLVITVALFQRRHNARCTTLEWLERWSMQFKLSTLMRSESQSEKGSVTVRVDGDTRQRSTSDASPVFGSLLIRRFLAKHDSVQALLKP